MATLVEHGHDISGTTAQRPTNADIGQRFFDTTLNAELVYNGSAWQLSGANAASNLTAAGINAGDANLDINGAAAATVTAAGGKITLTGAAGGATSGAGGSVDAVGGAGTAGNSAGGAVTKVGGAGQGSAAGGVAGMTGGVGGATGAGGAASVTGGAGGATSGAGGAVTITGGAGTAGNANGGAVTIRGGAKNGSGANGGLKLGAAVTDLVGLWGATPVVQPAGAAQAAVSAPTAYSAHSSGAVPVTSNAATDLDTTAAALATAVSELTALRTLVDAMRTALVDAGVIKGAA